jgi:hypothetical protein
MDEHTILKFSIVLGSTFALSNTVTGHKTKKKPTSTKERERIKWNVNLMGGLVRSSKDIDNLIIKSCKSIRSKKEKLRYQILRYNIVNIL